VNRDEILAHLSHWQDVLRLRDWDIKLEMAPAGWRKSGDIKIDLTDKKAVLLINERPRSENLEEVVVHELIHLKLYPLDQMLVHLIDAVFGHQQDDPKREFAYGQFMIILEPTAEDLTKGLLQAAGRGGELSWGRLRSQIDEEIGPR
jgi:hypothetical protein